MIKPPKPDEDEVNTWQIKAAKTLRDAVQAHIEEALRPIEQRLKDLEEKLWKMQS